ncbi:MAG: DUF4406 domain-containing protein [Alphaproteobacteria bacterium]|nr:DUF4406 domain-containing protein [Alphaproteobacteria bacterium]
MWVMVSGPYRAGSRTEAERQANLDVMNRAAYEVFKRGHVPVIGVNMALPIIQVMGAERYDELMMPVSLALVDRCDACLRVGGPSKGADDEAERFRAQGKPVFRSLDEIPHD